MYNSLSHWFKIVFKVWEARSTRQAANVHHQQRRICPPPAPFCVPLTRASWTSTAQVTPRLSQRPHLLLIISHLHNSPRHPSSVLKPAPDSFPLFPLSHTFHTHRSSAPAHYRLSRFSWELHCHRQGCRTRCGCNWTGHLFASDPSRSSSRCGRSSSSQLHQRLQSSPTRALFALCPPRFSERAEPLRVCHTHACNAGGSAQIRLPGRSRNSTTRQMATCGCSLLN